MGPGKGYIDVSTVDASTSSQIAAAVRAAGGHFLEAPVSGSKVGWAVSQGWLSSSCVTFPQDRIDV